MSIDWKPEAIEAAVSEAKRWSEGGSFRAGNPPVYFVCYDEDAVTEYSDRSARDAALDNMRMRAALDAAVKAQAMTTEDWMSGIGYCRGYEDALEEAAKVAWNYGDEVSVSKYDSASSAIAANRMAVNIAAAIRALKEKKG